VRERINLTDEEHYFLSQKITNTIKELYKDDYINSVYITNYQDSNNSKGTLNIVVLLESGVDYYTYDQLMEKLNSKIGIDNNTGVNVVFDCDYENKYSTNALNPSEVHRVE